MPTVLFSIKSVPRSSCPDAKSWKWEKRDFHVRLRSPVPYLRNTLFSRRPQTTAKACAIWSGKARSTGKGSWFELFDLHGAKPQTAQLQQLKMNLNPASGYL